ncbi:MAG: AMP-binding protein, partial [Actinophytocola sp.]|uniref:AMP-binding protein n=1 Tax=Actinophytocola sp. TaxID=1872138 RepID=UPI003D6AD410
MAARMSYVDGGVLPPLPVATLGAALTRAAGSAGGLHHLDEHGRRSTRSYRELAEDATAVLGGLRAAGARPGEHVVLQLAHGPDLLTAFWAAVLGGLVAVPVSAQAGADQLAAVGRVVG